MKWTQEQLESYERKQRAAKSKPVTAQVPKHGAAGICAAKQERAQGVTLERPSPGKIEGLFGCAGRVKITFRIYAVRPLDYDNYWTKCATDALVAAGILDRDDWNVLQGETISEKAHSKKEERTEILIEPL